MSGDAEASLYHSSEDHGVARSLQEQEAVRGGNETLISESILGPAGGSLRRANNCCTDSILSIPKDSIAVRVGIQPQHTREALTKSM
jgi:hypothetical protein